MEQMGGGNYWDYCWKGAGAFQGERESELLSNTLQWTIRGDEHTGKAKARIGKGCSDGEQQGKGNQENCSAPRPTVSGFTVMRLAFRLSLADHPAHAHIWPDSGSFPVMHASQSRWIPAGGFLGGWQDKLWAGVSSLLLAPPEFSWLFFFLRQHCVSYQDFLLWGNSSKPLLSWLVEVGCFSHWFPNMIVTFSSWATAEADPSFIEPEA